MSPWSQTRSQTVSRTYPDLPLRLAASRQPIHHSSAPFYHISYRAKEEKLHYLFRYFSFELLMQISHLQFHKIPSNFHESEPARSFLGFFKPNGAHDSSDVLKKSVSPIPYIPYIRSTASDWCSESCLMSTKRAAAEFSPETRGTGRPQPLR